MRKSSTAHTILIAALGGCVSYGANEARLARELRYDCSAELQTVAGKVISSRSVNARGEQLGVSAKWDFRDGQYANPWITGFWVQGGSADIELDQGRFNIMWHLHLWNEDKNRSVPQTLRLELHSQSTGNGLPVEPLLGTYEKSGGPFHFEAKWGDAVAMAKSASRLTLIARNKRGLVVEETEIDPKIISPAIPEIKNILERSAWLANDAPHQCMVEGENHIIVT